jgi:2,3-dihydroxyphenylpropionate 1,2-dioxygenase
VPTLADAGPAVLQRIVHGEPMTSEQRQARQTAVMDAAKSFAAGGSDLQPLNPVWDHQFLEIIDGGRLSEFDSWSNSFVVYEGGGSAHEIRTWLAAFAVLATAGPYQTTVRYYKPAAQLIAGFAIRTATPK